MALQFSTAWPRFLRCLIPVALFVFSSIEAQPTAPPQVAVAQARAGERLQPSLDLAQFQDAKQVDYLDLSYAVPLPVSDSPSAAGLLLDLRIYRDDSLWATKMWKIEEKETAPAPVASRRELVDRLRYLLSDQGLYRVVLYTRTLQPNAVPDSAVAFLQTRQFGDDNLELSDIILASQIKKAAGGAANAQSGYEVLPNPKQIYGEPVPTLYYYFEAYNMNTGVAGRIYKSYCRVENDNGAFVENLAPPYRTKKKLNDFSVEMGSIDVSALAGGVYTLVYGIADSAQNLQASRRKKFYVYNPAIVAGSSSGENALAGASEAALDDEFARMQHILPQEEKKMYKSLTNAAAKQNFLLSLWEAHKPEEYAGSMIYRKIYLARAREAEDKFPTVLRPGWKSDRGRVFMLYGPPSNIERVPSDRNNKPYEIWTFDEIQGGVIFVFADRTGFKNYELLHSTHRNELQNPDWKSQVTFENDQTGLQ